MLSNFLRLIRRCLALAVPFGRGKLLLVLGFVLANGIMQVIGVTSVFPFFALAADPERIRNSRFGGAILLHLPAMDHTALLIWAGVASIVLLLLSNAFALGGEVLRNHYGHGLGHFLRTRMLKALAQRPYGYFLERNSGALLQKLLGDIMIFISGVFLPLLEILSRLLTVGLLLLTVFFVQPVIAVAGGTLLGGFYLITFLLLRGQSSLVGEGLKKSNKGAHIAAQQLINGIKPILVQGKADYFVGLFSRHSAAQATLNAKLPMYSNGPRYLVEPIAFGGLVLAVLLLAVKGRSFNDILPNLTVMALAAYRILPSLQLLYGQFTQINAARYAVAEVEAEMVEFAPAEAEKGEPMALRRLTFEKEIRLEKITFSYPSAVKPVVEDFSLVIPRHSSIGIAGTTGSGKSTLVDILLGLHRPQGGRITIDGHMLVEADLPAWRALIGYVPQEIYLLDATIAENIALGIAPEEIDQEALRTSARQAQILDFIENELPEKWETRVGERGVRLSGGQRQRMGLARALYHEPELLVLDEATSALDSQTEASVMQTIRDLQKSVTMVIVAHRLSTLESCTRVIQLGKIETTEPMPS